MHRRIPCELLVVALLAVSFCVIYIPDIGHGFVRDDFMWVRAGRIQSLADISAMLTGNVGFYRPVVTITFAADHVLFGLHPFPYALTNLLLLGACAVLIARLSTRLGIAGPWSIAAAALWAFNFHAVTMTLLWLSGRTALLLCLFELLAMLAATRDRWGPAAAWTLLAVLSKEETVVFPFVLAAWAWYTRTDHSILSAARIVRRAWAVFVPLAIYAVLRVHSGAIGPLNAPSYYQFTFAPGAVLRNVLEYADRSSTTAAIPVVIVALAARARIDVAAGERRALAFAVLWLVAGFAITVFLPVRSDLYALTPSVGSAIAAGAVLQAYARRAPVITRRVLAAFVAVPILLLPLYRARNVRWVAPADLSARLVADLRAATPQIPNDSHLLFVDTSGSRLSLSSAFDGLIQDATTLYVGRGCTGEIVDASDRLLVPPSSGPIRVFRRVGDNLQLDATRR